MIAADDGAAGAAQLPEQRDVPRRVNLEAVGCGREIGRGMKRRRAGNAIFHRAF
jgi:hypothetical protein